MLKVQKHTNKRTSGKFCWLHLRKHLQGVFLHTQKIRIVRNLEFVDIYGDNDSLKACPQGGTSIFVSDHETA